MRHLSYPVFLLSTKNYSTASVFILVTLSENVLALDLNQADNLRFSPIRLSKVIKRHRVHSQKSRLLTIRYLIPNCVLARPMCRLILLRLIRKT